MFEEGSPVTGGGATSQGIGPFRLLKSPRRVVDEVDVTRDRKAGRIVNNRTSERFAPRSGLAVSVLHRPPGLTDDEWLEYGKSVGDSDAGWMPAEPAYTPALPIVRDMLDALVDGDRETHLDLSGRLNAMIREGLCAIDDVHEAMMDTGYAMFVMRLGGCPVGTVTSEQMQTAVVRGSDRLLADGWLREL